jgi:hypothetical protein
MLPIGALTLGVPQREGRRMGVLLHSSQRTDVSGRFYIPEHVMNECAAEHVDKDYKHTANQYALVKLIEPRLLRHRQRTTDLTEADAVYVSLGIFQQMKDRSANLPGAAKVNCRRCWLALRGLFASLAERPELRVFTAIGNVFAAFYRFGSRSLDGLDTMAKLSSTPEECSAVHDWLLFRNHSRIAWNHSQPDVHVVSIEGFDVQAIGGKCEWRHRLPGFEHSVTQDWSLSVAYSAPKARYLGHQGKGVRLSTASDEELRAYVRELRSEGSVANRTQLCAFVGNLDRDPLRHMITEGCSVNTPGVPGLPAPQDIYRSSKYCLQPPGTTPSRAGYFDSILSGCVPVVFSRSHQCAFYDWAYLAQLPPQHRAGFGAGDYSVLLDSERAAEDLNYTRQQLESIPDDQYRRMLKTLLGLQRQVIYSQGATAERDAVQLISEQFTRRRVAEQDGFGEIEDGGGEGTRGHGVLAARAWPADSRHDQSTRRKGPPTASL